MDPYVQSEWPLAHYRIADFFRSRSDLDGALALLQRGLAIVERIVAQYPENPHYLRTLAMFTLQLGGLQQARLDHG